MAEPARKIPLEDLDNSMESLDHSVPRDNVVDFNKYREEKARARALRSNQFSERHNSNDEATEPTEPSAPAIKSDTSAQPTAASEPTENLDSPAAADETEDQPQTRAEQAQKNLEQQRKDLDQKSTKKDEVKKQLDQQTQEKNWRRHLTAMKLKKAEKEEKKSNQAVQKLEESVNSLLGTGFILKAAWLNLLDTFGLSYFYIPFHYLMAYYTPFSGFFCKFGEEWIPKGAKAAAGEMGKKLSKPLELLEIIGCFLLGFLWLIVIFAVIMIVAVVAYAWLHPIDTLYQVTGFSWTFIKCIGGYVFGVGVCGGNAPTATPSN